MLPNVFKQNSLNASIKLCLTYLQIGNLHPSLNYRWQNAHIKRLTIRVAFSLAHQDFYMVRDSRIYFQTFRLVFDKATALHSIREDMECHHFLVCLYLDFNAQSGKISISFSVCNFLLFVWSGLSQTWSMNSFVLTKLDCHLTIITLINWIKIDYVLL